MANVNGMLLVGVDSYLELADWVLEDAIRAAREDRDWEQKQQRNQLSSSSPPSSLPSKHVDNRRNTINNIHSNLARPLQQRQEMNQQRLPSLSSTSSPSHAADDIHSNLTRPLLAEYSMVQLHTKKVV